MHSGERFWRAALPEMTHEWAVVPEDEPRGCEFDQAVGGLPVRSDPWVPVPMEVVNPHAGQQALRAAMPWWSSSRNVLILRDEAAASVGGVLAPHGELLPLAGRNAHLVLFTAGSVYVRLDKGTFARDIVRDHKAFVVRVSAVDSTCSSQRRSCEMSRAPETHRA